MLLIANLTSVSQKFTDRVRSADSIKSVVMRTNRTFVFSWENYSCAQINK